MAAIGFAEAAVERIYAGLSFDHELVLGILVGAQKTLLLRVCHGVRGLC